MNETKNEPKVNWNLDPQLQIDLEEYTNNRRAYKKIQYHAGNAKFYFVLFGEVKLKSRKLSDCVAARDEWIKENGKDFRKDAAVKFDFTTNKNIRVGKAVVPYNRLREGWVLPGMILERNHAYALAAAKQLNHFLGGL